MEKLFKRFFLIQVFFSIILISQAFAQETSEEKISIQLANGETISINANPDLEDMKKTLGLSVSDEIRKKIESKGGVVENVDPLSGWKTLSAPDQQRFSDLRLNYVKQVVKILDKMHGLIGVGIVAGDAIKFTVQKTKKIFVKPKDSTAAEKKEMSERKRAAIEGIARTIDYKMWFQAPLLINANEFGIQASIGIIGLGGLHKKGGGGLEEVGISLAYNKDAKAFVFEVFHNGERFDNAMMPAFNVGINGKANVTMKAAPKDGTNKVSEGSTFYPPAFPGSTSYGPDMYAAGMSSGVGFPPPPIGDLLTFTNTYKRTALIKISVSPLMKGFVRISVGDLRVPVKSILYRFVDIFNGIKYLVSKKASPVVETEIKKTEPPPAQNQKMIMSCEGLFAA
ncbi:MAG: hypothetical protein H7235_04640 [Bdellovibrionaceae bacterium]|nr:hypothetical protein [Pseudobdellovibrionaceae bacterium]